MKLVSLRRLYFDGNHNAFTDICFFKGYYYATFRTGTRHVSEDGRILVMRGLDSGKRWMVVASIYSGKDTRDPKLLVRGDELFVYSFLYDPSVGRRFKATGFSVTTDGDVWSAWEHIEDEWVYWRPAVFDGKVYCIAYAPDNDRTMLKVSEDGRRWTDVCPVTEKKGAEWPNEASLTFKDDGTAYALIRREYGTGRPFLSQALPPYTEWHHMELDLKLQGPLIWLAGGELWICGRWYQPSGLVNTAVFRIDGMHVAPQLILPSGGDCSYAGIVKKPDCENEYFMTYYSSHEARPADSESNATPAGIYLAELEIP